MNNEKIEDGIYVEFFAVKDGERYNVKVVSMKDIATTLTGSLMDGIESLVNNEVDYERGKRRLCCLD